ncbi:hypothetical protein CEXT_408071 [Caerostris extrusa]|uniref:Uncharacterized protein n=1 Tax=Caerostris extrusa TaxID=172846 RepID=A0AAV4MFU5_CAEEX|nr:hypothetical protein CEXT_408071 [Caerostris extrusa]
MSSITIRSINYPENRKIHFYNFPRLSRFAQLLLFVRNATAAFLQTGKRATPPVTIITIVKRCFIALPSVIEHEVHVMYALCRMETAAFWVHQTDCYLLE